MIGGRLIAASHEERFGPRAQHAAGQPDHWYTLRIHIDGMADPVEIDVGEADYLKARERILNYNSHPFGSTLAITVDL